MNYKHFENIDKLEFLRRLSDNCGEVEFKNGKLKENRSLQKCNLTIKFYNK